MRKCLSVILLLLYLVGTTEAYQLLKVPALLAHYSQHKQANPHLTIGQFLRMHYNEEAGFDSDWAQDMQLPFKSHEDASSLLPFAYMPPVHLQAIIHPAFVVKQEHGMAIWQFHAGIYAADIFQPPRC